MSQGLLLDEFDQMDPLDELDELDELDGLDSLDELGEIDPLDEFVDLDRLEEARRPARPRFRFACPAGCHWGSEAQCRRVLLTAINDAIRLAGRAAARLEQRPRTAQIVGIFRFVFGHAPNRQVPWGGGRDSGAIVAHRLRAAARSLQTRGTRYQCANIPPNARVVSPGRVLIGPTFWRQSAPHRAGTILHEMMHQYFISFIRHDARERRRNNAHCYEVFALRASGLNPSAHDVNMCRSRPA